MWKEGQEFPFPCINWQKIAIYLLSFPVTSLITFKHYQKKKKKTVKGLERDSSESERKGDHFVWKRAAKAKELYLL